MANMFRLLRADEIDVRIGNTNKAKTKANLLLYKDARCDQNVLDEAVGPMNWQKSYTRENANCIVSLWDDEKSQWISKEDTGVESRTEAEKGLASDSFKRACFCWGIGRELYTAPNIWVPYDPDNYESYSVADIGYDENRNINKLAITNKNGEIVFKYGDVTIKSMGIKPEPLPEDAQKPGEKVEMPKTGSWDPRKAVTKWCAHVGLKMEDFARLRAALVSAHMVKDIKSGDLDPIEFENLCNAIKDNYPDALRNVV